MREKSLICNTLPGIGKGSKIGAGVRNVNKYLPPYTKGGKSEFIEDQIFIINFYLEYPGKAALAETP